MNRLSQKIKFPSSESELLDRAHKLAGLNLTELSNLASLPCPTSLHQQKGFRGLLLEHLLGATAGNASAPDFEHLGIELKSLPVSSDGKVKETTFICTAPIPFTELDFFDSCFYHKIKRVLWVPVETNDTKTLGELRLGTSFLWSPSSTELRQLQQDWEELSEAMILGQWDTLTAHRGEIVQVRPKAAHSRIKANTHDEDGDATTTGPRGFYLRRFFTQGILEHALSI